MSELTYKRAKQLYTSYNEGQMRHLCALRDVEIDRLRDENAKLRDLCADIYKGFRGAVFERWSYSSEDFRMYERYMRKMGIEVD